MPTFPPFPAITPDPIFRVAAEARAAGPAAIDGTIGMVLDEEGKVLTFECVRRAAQDVSANFDQTPFGYSPLLGLPEYRAAVERLIVRDASLYISSIATTGGTGAVALNIRLANLLHPELTIIQPTPAWVNHQNLCRAAGTNMKEVALCAGGVASTAPIVDELMKMNEPSCVLLQVGCHNPTGLAYSPEQWRELFATMEKQHAVALLDFAYQGFAGTPEDDALPIRLAIGAGVTTLVSWSASKNHSLYSERVGLAAAVVPDAKIQQQINDHYAILARGMYSGAPRFGQQIVAHVQDRYHREWLEELATIRALLIRKRAMLTAALPEDLRPSLRGHGMFALLPLTPKEIQRLRTEHQVFLGDDGRINIAGIPLRRMEELGEKIRRVRKED